MADRALLAGYPRIQHKPMLTLFTDSDSQSSILICVATDFNSLNKNRIGFIFCMMNISWFPIYCKSVFEKKMYSIDSHQSALLKNIWVTTMTVKWHTDGLIKWLHLVCFNLSHCAFKGPFCVQAIWVSTLQDPDQPVSVQYGGIVVYQAVWPALG